MNDGAPASGYVYSRSIPGSEKVAVLLLALDRSVSSQLLHHFDPAEIGQIRTAADNLEPITQSDLAMLVEEFADQFAGGMSFVGTPNEVHSLLNTAFAETTDDAPDLPEAAPTSETAATPIWQRLVELPEEQLLALLQGEHPQMIAVVLSSLDPERSSGIITQLESDMSADIMRRMVKMADIDARVMALVEGCLEEFLAANADDGSSSQAHARIADMINRMGGEQRQRMIDDLAVAVPEDAHMIKKLLFSFADIIKLTELDCQILVGAVATDVLVTALNGVDEALSEKILSSLSARNRRMVEGELKGGTSPKPSEVENAQFQVVSTALELIREEKIAVQDDDTVVI